MPGERVLICDDELQILRALKVVLRDAGFEVVATATAEEALDAAAVHPPEAAIIDLVLPNGDGVDVCRSLRKWSDMPIIVLSALGEEEQKVRALDAGADDYVTKPFSPGELIARLNAVLRRVPGAAEKPLLEVDGLTIDLAPHRVTRNGDELHLSKTEYELLRVLASNRGRLMTHRSLLTEVWGPGYASDTQVLRTTVARLRSRVGKDLIHTDPGVGYRIDA